MYESPPLQTDFSQRWVFSTARQGIRSEKGMVTVLVDLVEVMAHLGEPYWAPGRWDLSDFRLLTMVNLTRRIERKQCFVDLQRSLPSTPVTWR